MRTFQMSNSQNALTFLKMVSNCSVRYSKSYEESLLYLQGNLVVVLASQRSTLAYSNTTVWKLNFDLLKLIYPSILMVCLLAMLGKFSIWKMMDKLTVPVKFTVIILPSFSSKLEDINSERSVLYKQTMQLLWINIFKLYNLLKRLIWSSLTVPEIFS